MTLPDVNSIRMAQRRTRDHIVRSRLVPSQRLSSQTGADVLLKLETDQPTGSFKVRGASNAILAMLEHRALPGVTTASTGNHARAVTYVGRRLGIAVRAFVSRYVSDDRVRALVDAGAKVDTSSVSQSAAIAAAANFAAEHGYGFVAPFDHPDVISGQGTIGLELCEDLDRLDAVIIPVSGGGLVSGVGLALKALRPAVRVIGVGAELAPAMHESLSVGRPVATPEVATVAESLMGDLGPDNRFTFQIARRVIDEIHSVPESAITAAMAGLRDEDGVVVEGAGAVAAAYLASERSRWRGSRVALLVTGNAGAQTARGRAAGEGSDQEEGTSWSSQPVTTRFA
jgi:threonine dehydratase